MNLNDLFGDQKIDIECDCGEMFQVPFADVSNDGSQVVCPHCQAVHIIKHDETTKKTIADGETALNDFEGLFKDLKF